MAKKKKEDTLQDIIDRVLEDIELINEKAAEMQEQIDSADIDESDED